MEYKAIVTQLICAQLSNANCGARSDEGIVLTAILFADIIWQMTEPLPRNSSDIGEIERYVEQAKNAPGPGLPEPLAEKLKAAIAARESIPPNLRTT